VNNGRQAGVRATHNNDVVRAVALWAVDVVGGARHWVYLMDDLIRSDMNARGFEGEDPPTLKSTHNVNSVKRSRRCGATRPTSARAGRRWDRVIVFAAVRPRRLF